MTDKQTIRQNDGNWAYTDFQQQALKRYLHKDVFVDYKYQILAKELFLYINKYYSWVFAA